MLITNMAGNEPKRRRLDDDISLFTSFHRNEEAMNKLRLAFTAHDSAFNQMKLCLLHIEELDARLSEDFLRASIQTTHICQENNDFKTYQTFPIGRIFEHGLIILRNYIFERQVPREMHLRSALGRLLQFFTSEMDNDDLSETGEGGQWIVKIAQHILTKLAVTDSYTIDRFVDMPPENMDYCPCKKKDAITGKVGNTSFGCSRGWYGWSDVLIHDSIPNSVTGNAHGENGDASSAIPSVSSSVIVNPTSNFTDQDLMQIMAQSIVFSFLQHKENKETLSNFLIPGIGMSSNKVIVYFYDCVEDVLLGTAPVTFLKQIGHWTLDPAVTLLFWLVLNYRHLCSGLTDQMRDLKADFFQHVGEDFLEIYREEVTRPLPKIEAKSDEVTYGWSTLIEAYDSSDAYQSDIDFVSLPDDCF